MIRGDNGNIVQTREYPLSFHGLKTKEKLVCTRDPKRNVGFFSPPNLSGVKGVVPFRHVVYCESRTL